MNEINIIDFWRLLSFEDKSIVVLVVFLSMGAIVALIRLLRRPLSPLPYTEGNDKIGHYGPAGGIVFYDKGYYSDSWRYLEAAPRETEFVASWGAYNITTGAKDKTIGSGKQNTRIIIDCIKQAESNTASQLCENLVFNGYNDWFLPSEDELRLMYYNLKTKRIGGFRNVLYWSSSEQDKSYAFYFCFGFWSDSDLYDKHYRFCVRAIRSF